MPDNIGGDEGIGDECLGDQPRRSESTTPKAEQMSSANSITRGGGVTAVADLISSKSGALEITLVGLLEDLEQAP